jgi:hypothetical protein
MAKGNKRTRVLGSERERKFRQLVQLMAKLKNVVDMEQQVRRLHGTRLDEAEGLLGNLMLALYGTWRERREARRRLRKLQRGASRR